MGVFLWIIFGALAGWIASLIMKTDMEQGGLLNIFVGIIGAVVGGWVMGLIGGTGVTGFNLYSLLVAVVGACIFVGLLKFLRK
jgi:uncharacterized membrane protein YeaQ/YmgE (transglycosylase-associated protein family)